MKIAIALVAVLLIAVAVFTSVADAQLWRWMMKALGLIVGLVVVVRIIIYVTEAWLKDADRKTRFQGNFNDSEYFISSRGYAGPEDSRQVDNQPDPELIEQLRNTWQDEKQG